MDMQEATPVLVEKNQSIAVITINRPRVRNAVDRSTARMLVDVFQEFDHDDDLNVAILTGAEGTFCAGADLREMNRPREEEVSPENWGPAPMGPTWMLLDKPVIAAIEGYAVGGGLELAVWCDLRVSARNAVFGVFNHRFGLPLMDLGTVRLPRLIGQSHALDIVLTGRGVTGEEALRMGLVNRLVEPGRTLQAALELADSVAKFPQGCIKSDRLSVYEQWALPWEQARYNETRRGLEALASRQTATESVRSEAGSDRRGESET